MCIATSQILGTYATLISDVLFEPLKSFFENMAFVTEVAGFFGWFGVSCAHYELRTCRARLLISIAIPIVLVLSIALVLMLRVLLSRQDCVRRLRRTHATFALLVLYVTLPSTSTMIFKAFVRDSRPLGTNGEKYLIADYAGTSRSISHV